MAYADLTYYRETYIGRACPDDAELTRLLARAADDIDLYTSYGIIIENLLLWEQELIKKSNCAQAENYVVNGDGLDNFDNLSLGSFSISGGKAYKGNTLALNAMKYLNLTSFGFRGIQCARYRVRH